MGINKDFFVEQHVLEWGGKTVAELRGLTPDDITRLLASESANVEQIFNTVEGQLDDEQARNLDMTDTAAVSAVLKDRAKPAMLALLGQFPDLIAKVIAIACDEPDAGPAVKKWVVPLQVEALSQIARLTFVDAAGFETFLGNVMALARTMRREPAPARLRSVG